MALKRFLANQASQPSGWFGTLVAGRVFNKSNRNMEDMALSRMPVKTDSTVLEIGFGNGRFIGNLGAQLQAGKVSGVEISKTMIRQARKNNRQLIEKGVVELLDGSIGQLPFDDDQFDMVATFNTLYFWPEPEKNIREVMRVLKPGGGFYCGIRPEDQMKKVSVMEQNRDIYQHLFSPDYLRKFLSDAGFSDVSVDYQQDKPMDTILASARK